jgi:hypothetical protein
MVHIPSSAADPPGRISLGAQLCLFWLTACVTTYLSGELMKQRGDMSQFYTTIFSEEIYTTTLSEENIQLIAEEKILKHGDDAFAAAAKEISALNARGDFSLAGSWVLVCRRIRELQALNYDAPLGSAASDRG